MAAEVCRAEKPSLCGKIEHVLNHAQDPGQIILAPEPDAQPETDANADYNAAAGLDAHAPAPAADAGHTGTGRGGERATEQGSQEGGLRLLHCDVM